MSKQPGRGLDVGTSHIIASRELEDGKVLFTEFRDAFYRLKPATPIARKMMEKGLKGQQYFSDIDGSFIVVGQDAIERAIERNESASRPMVRGVISPKEKNARRILRHIFKEILDTPLQDNEKLVYSVPSQPVDRSSEDFDVGFHQDAIGNDLRDLGFDASPLPEAEAICYSELEKEDYTGMAFSFGAGMCNICLMSSGEGVLHFATVRCLAKGYLISTQRGLVPISSIEPGDLVTDNYGSLAEVSEVLNNGYRQELTRLTVEGYSEYLDMTEDHRVWVKRKGQLNWDWVRAKEISLGDTLGVPIVKPSYPRPQKMYLKYKDNKRLYSKGVSRELGRFIGFFLGDGNSYIVSSNLSDGRVSISLDLTKEDCEEKRDLLIDLIKDLFNKEASFSIQQDDNCLIIKFFSKDIANRLNTLCYDEQGEKRLKWPCHKINHQMALGIIEGICGSDGYLTDGRYCLEITSSQVALLFQDLLARFGIRTTFTIRNPRKGGLNRKGQRIIGKKDIYSVEIGHRVDNKLLGYLFTLSETTNLPVTPLDFIERKVISNTSIEYNDDVYDLVVASEHKCFSSPGGVIHNSGDYIDHMASLATDSPDTVVQVEKEGSSFTVGQEVENSPILSAISLYYCRLIDYTIKHMFSYVLSANKLPKFSKPISLVIAGGTSQARGFVEEFKKTIEKYNSDDNPVFSQRLPFQIKEIRAAKSQLRAVARGLLIAANL